MMHKHIRAYIVQDYNLPIATKEMNCDEDCFRSRVIKVLPCVWDKHEKASVVILEIEGYYPYITNKWGEFARIDK